MPCLFCVPVTVSVAVDVAFALAHVHGLADSVALARVVTVALTATIPFSIPKIALGGKKTKALLTRGGSANSDRINCKARESSTKSEHQRRGDNEPH